MPSLRRSPSSNVPLSLWERLVSAGIVVFLIGASCALISSTALGIGDAPAPSPLLTPSVSGPSSIDADGGPVVLRSSEMPADGGSYDASASSASPSSVPPALRVRGADPEPGDLSAALYVLDGGSLPSGWWLAPSRMTLVGSTLVTCRNDLGEAQACCAAGNQGRFTIFWYGLGAGAVLTAALFVVGYIELKR